MVPLHSYEIHGSWKGKYVSGREVLKSSYGEGKPLRGCGLK